MKPDAVTTAGDAKGQTATSFAPEASDADPPSPNAIFELTSAYRASRVLTAAVELDLFGMLAAGPAGEERIREELGLHPRGAGDFLDALVVLGLLERADGEYRNSPLSARYLDRGQPTYLGGCAELSASTVFPAWARLTTALRTGEPQVEPPSDDTRGRIRQEDPDRFRRFLSSMDAVNGRLAEELARCVDWSRYG
ncbi:methyltransferase family protein, partial [Wenjunlia tyrosinilytica]|uniref:methyltransferase family protein n=1 Tax=Wenjunlia tyrosinilytica TaxID=1544741 RepID=UPI0027E548BA